MAKRYIDDSLVAYVDPADTFLASNGTRLAPPLEDYSIYVSLKVAAKGKNYGMSSDGGTYQLTWEAGGREIKNMIEGSTLQDTSPNSRTTLKYLTSDGTEFVYRDIADGKVDTHEMLGISSINIDYTNFFVPQITIQFVDVHGASLFGPETEYHTDGYVKTKNGWGEDTTELRTGIQRNDIQAPFLHAFFTFPYPNYRLEIKGLYGMGVSYDLTMSNWTSSFDSSTGNFNVTATLIGYTYAMLNDLAMSAIITAPINGYEGYAYWENVIRGNIDKYYLLGRNSSSDNGQTSKVEIPRFATIMGALKDAQIAIQKIKKQHDENYKGINSVPNNMEALSAKVATLVHGVTEMIQSRDITFTDVGGDPYFYYVGNNGGIYLMAQENQKVQRRKNTATDMDSKDDENAETEEVDVIELIRKEFEDQAKVLNGEFSSYMGAYAYTAGEEDQDQEYTFNKIGTQLFKSNGENYVDFKTGTCDEIRVSDMYNEMGLSVPDDFFSKYKDCVAVLINTKNAQEILRRAFHYTDQLHQQRAKALESSIKDVYQEKLGFVPTIRNVMTILFAHVETFMHCMDKIRDGVFEAMRDDGERSYTKVSQAINMKESTDLRNDQYGLPPFPLCIRKNSRGMEEKTWLGELPFSSIRVKPEVDFIEGALTAVEEFNKTLDDTGLSDGGSVAPTIAGEDGLPDFRGDLWHVPYPICPFDFANTTKVYPGYEHSDASPWGIGLNPDANDMAFRVNNRIKMLGKVRMNQSNNHKLISQIYGLIDAQNFYAIYDKQLTPGIVDALTKAKDKIIDGGTAAREAMFYNGNYTSAIGCTETTPAQFNAPGSVNNCASSAIRYVKNTILNNEDDYTDQIYDVLITPLDGVAQFSAYATGWKDLSTLQMKHTKGDFKYSGQTDAGEENRIGYPKSDWQYFGQKLYQLIHDEKDIEFPNPYYGIYAQKAKWSGWERFKIRDRAIICMAESYGEDLIYDARYGTLRKARVDGDDGYGKDYYKDLVEGHIVNEFRKCETDGNYVIGTDSGLYYHTFSDTVRTVLGSANDDFGDFVAKEDCILPCTFGSDRYYKVGQLTKFTDAEKRQIKAFMFLNSLNIRNFGYENILVEGCTTLPKALVLNYGSYVAMYRIILKSDGTVNREKADELIGIIFNKVENDGTVEFFRNVNKNTVGVPTSSYGTGYDYTAVDYACQYQFKFDKNITIEPKSTNKFATAFNDKMLNLFNNWVTMGLDETPDSFADIEGLYEFLSLSGVTTPREYGRRMYDVLENSDECKLKEDKKLGKTSFVIKTKISDQDGSIDANRHQIFATLDLIKKYERQLGIKGVDYTKFETEQSGPYVEMVGFDKFGNIYALNAPAPEDKINVHSRMIARLLLQPILVSIPQMAINEDNKHRINLETEEYFKAFAYEVDRLFYLKDNEYRPEITYNEDGTVQSTVVRNPNVPKEVKVALYNYLKNLYDRWLDNPWCDGESVEGSKTLAQEYGLDYFMGPYIPSIGLRDGGHFVFIDSYYNRIDDFLNINLTELIRQIQASLQVENRTLLQFVTELFAKHKITVQCIQNFADLSTRNTNENKIINNLFRPVPLSQKGYTSPKSYFIGLYAGEPAQTSINKDRKDEGLYLTGPNENIKKVKIPLNQPHGGYRIPAFAVAYGDQYQHYFQDINVGMSTSLATEQSIKTQFELARMANTDSEVEAIGQDLYTVYSNNSYETTIKMLGCPWIQPTMYFEMLNIPMFNGAYMVKKVNHNITPGYMETTIHGIRQNRLSTPCITDPIVVNDNITTPSLDLGGSNRPTSSFYRMELTYEYYTDADVENEIPDDREEDLRGLSDNAYRTFYRIKKSIEACEWARNLQGQKFNVDVLAPDIFMLYNGGHLDIIFDLILKKYDKDIATLSWVTDSLMSLTPNGVIVTVDNNLPKVFQENGTTFTIDTTTGGTSKNNKDAGCTVNLLTEGEVTGLYIEHMVDSSKPTASFTGPLFAKYISKVTQEEYTGNHQVLSQRVQREIDEMTVDRIKNMSNTDNYPQLASNVAYADLGDDKDKNAEYLRNYLADGGNAFRQRLGGMDTSNEEGGGLPFWSDGNEVRLGDGRMACFTVSDLCKSDTARARHIDNKPDTETQYQCLMDIIVNILQPVCDKYGKDRMKLNSGFRCRALNDVIPGSSKTSQHSKGQAIDFELLDENDPNKTINAALFAFIVNYLDFDQIIWEKGGAWVHVSFNKGHNRHLICKGPINGHYPSIAANWQQEIRWDGDYHF